MIIQYCERKFVLDLYDRLFGDPVEENSKKQEEPKVEVTNVPEAKPSEAAPAKESEPEIRWSGDFLKKTEEKAKESAPVIEEKPVAAPASFGQTNQNMEKALGTVGEALEEMEKAASAASEKPLEQPAAAPVERNMEQPAAAPLEKPIEKPVPTIGEEEQKTLMKPEDGDDRLFEQIDAFREKAQQLSAIIHSKQTKVSNLEALVGEKEAQNRYLHDEVDRLKSQSDKIVIELDSRINVIKESLSSDIGDLKTKFLEKADNANAPLMEKVDAMNASFAGMKDEVFDKVHTENLQAYKNVQSFIQENDKSEDNRVRITTEIYKLKKFFGFLIFLGIVDTAGIAFIILHMLNLLPWF